MRDAIEAFDCSSDPDLEARLSLAMSVARDAGTLLLRWLGRIERVDTKGAADLVTVADRESEALVVQRILHAFPSDGVLGEEGASREGSSGWRWVIDPLDGTTNFVHAFPVFMVSIGLLRDGQRTAGVCYGPIRDELFAAVRGQGARRNGVPISVSRVAGLDGALTATGFPYGSNAAGVAEGQHRVLIESMLARVGRALSLTHGIRRAGSACYDLCFLANGNVDVYFEQGLKPWDMAAATLIAEEAGARISRYDGSEFDIDTPNLLATNGLLHEAALTRIIQGGGSSAANPPGAGAR